MRAYAEVRNATTSRSWRCRVGGGLRRVQQRLQKTAKNTNRIPFAIETSLRARALEYRYITPSVRSTPRVRALSRGEDDVVDGDAAETKGKDEGQSIWRRGRKIGKPKKLERFDDEAPGVSKIARPDDRPLAQCARRARVTTRSRAMIVRSRRSRCHERRHDTLGAIAHSKPRAASPAASIARGRGRKIFRDAGSFEGRMRLIRGGVSDGRGKRS